MLMICCGLLMQSARCYLLGRLRNAERPPMLFNTVISSCLHHQRMDLVTQLFRVMDREGVQRDAVSWNLAIRAQVDVLYLLRVAWSSRSMPVMAATNTSIK